MNRTERRRSARSSKRIKRVSGHPAKLAAIKARVDKPDESLAPDATEKVIQKMIRELREEIRHGHPDDGVITGPLMVASRYAAKVIGEEHSDLDQDMLARWLAAQCGDVIRAFDVEAFRAWDAGRRERIAVA
jgi:hypothetical protein